VTNLHHLKQYAVLPHTTEIVTWPQITMTSLHPMYLWRLLGVATLLLYGQVMSPRQIARTCLRRLRRPSGHVVSLGVTL